MSHCLGTTDKGEPCKMKPKKGQKFCYHHQKPAAAALREGGKKNAAATSKGKKEDTESTKKKTKAKAKVEKKREQPMITLAKEEELSKKIPLKLDAKLTSYPRTVSYITQDNNPDPYKVVLTYPDAETNPVISVFPQDDGRNSDQEDHFLYQKTSILSLLPNEYQSLHFGNDYICNDCGPWKKSANYSTQEGAAFLIHIGKKNFIFVGSLVTRFEMADRFITFLVFPDGRDSTIMPAVIGEQFVYLPADSLVLEKKFLTLGSSPFLQYVDHDYQKRGGREVSFKFHRIHSF